MTQTVDVVIATFRRPDRLRQAIESLHRAALSAPNGWQVGVTIVDDDPEGSARSVADEAVGLFARGCTYVPCGSRNISHARNAGLESAVDRADWLGSIDDDVVVPPDWFGTCAAAVETGGFNAVTGPLLKDFSRGPSWLTREPFDQLGILAGTDGERAFVCATGNYWVRAEFLRRFPSLRFAPELGRTGGEDMDFFYRAVEIGLRPVFSSAAAVTEKEPAARCTLRYQLRRAYWLGVSEAQVSQRLALASRKRLVARAIRRAADRGARQLPPERLASRGTRYTLAVLAQCAGLVLGTLGLRMRHK